MGWFPRLALTSVRGGGTPRATSIRARSSLLSANKGNMCVERISKGMTGDSCSDSPRARILLAAGFDISQTLKLAIQLDSDSKHRFIKQLSLACGNTTFQVFESFAATDGDGK